MKKNEIAHLCWESNQVQSGRSTFLCLSENPDRQAMHIREALRLGAVAILAKRLPNSQASDSRIQWFEHHAFQDQISQLSRSYYQSPDRHLQLYGVTGTNGKTTTAWFMYHLLNLHEPAALIGTLGIFREGFHQKTPWTTPESPVLMKTFRDLKENQVKSLAMEVSSIGIEEKRIAGLTFQSLAFTNLTQDHLDYHHTLEKYYQAKKSFFVGHSHPKSYQVIFTDDPFGERLLTELNTESIPGTRISVGFKKHGGSHLQIVVTKETLHGTDFQLHAPWGDTSFSLPILARYNVANFAVAWASVRSHQSERDRVSSDEATASKPFHLPSGRLESISTPKGLAFVDYAHTPDALANVLEVLASRKGSNRLVVVFGCGGDRDRTKRAVMGEIASRYADGIVLTADNSRSERTEEIIRQIETGVLPTFPRESLMIEPDRKNAILKAYQWMKSGDVLCVAGKGHEQTQTDTTGTHPFSDQEVLRQLSHV